MTELSKEKQASKFKSLFQLVLFGIIGVSNTIVDIVIYWLLVQISVPYLLSNIVSYGAGMLNSYLLNKNITFRMKQQEKLDRHVSIRFVIWNLITLAISSGLMVIAIEWLGWSTLWSKLIVTLCIVLLQFAGTKKWVFRQ